MEYGQILAQLKSLANPESVKGMARFGINPEHALGVSIPNLRKIAKKAGKNHSLAQRLWSSEIHEARILASMVEIPEEVTEEQMERWVRDFDSWDLCDQCCMNLIRRTENAHEKASEWSSREEEFVKRAGFALMATLAVHDKKARDEDFLKFMPAIERESTDGRNYVKKAVNWALRQIGKRNMNLRQEAVGLAEAIREIDSKPAKWIASDALRELTSDAVRKRIGG